MSDEINMPLFEVTEDTAGTGFDVVIRIRKQLGGSLANNCKGASTKSPRHSALVALGYKIGAIVDGLYATAKLADDDGVTIEDREPDKE